MRAQRFLPWLSAFTREWLVPKASLAAAVVAVSAILFSMDPGPELPAQAQARFDRLFAPPQSPLLIPLLVLTLTLFLVALYARHRAGGRVRWMYWIDRGLPWLASAGNLLLGVFLVPLTVAITALNMIQGSNTDLLDWFAISATVFATFGSALHYMGGTRSQPRHFIAYKLSLTQPGADPKRLHYLCCTRLSEILSHVRWHANPEVTTETEEGCLLVVVPFYLHSSVWTRTELGSLLIYLAAIELEWRQSGISITRLRSPGFLDTSDAVV